MRNEAAIGDRIDVFKIIGKYSPKLAGIWVSANDDNDGTFRIAQIGNNRYIEDFELVKVGTMVIKNLK